MLKTLLVSEVFPPQLGGSGRWFWELYRRLPREAVVVAAGAHPDAAEFDRTHDLRIERVPLRLRTWGLANRRGLGDYARAVRQVARLARREEVEVLHCGRCLPEGVIGWMVQRLIGVPYVCYAHGEELTLAHTSRELRWLAKRSLRGAARVIANSRHTKGLVERDWGVPSDKITVLHPGVDTNRFVPAARDLAVRERLGWGDRPVLLTVGALQKRKGQDMVIRALPTIRQQAPDVLYSIAGEGWERGYLEKLVADLELESHVQFRGAPGDDELLDCYQQCDVFVLANRQVGWDFEGFGIVLLEAQACGKPVIVGNSGGAPETVSPGITGCVVDGDRTDAIAASAIGALRNLPMPDTLHAECRRWVKERFDWSALVTEASAAFRLPTASLAVAGCSTAAEPSSP